MFQEQQKQNLDKDLIMAESSQTASLKEDIPSLKDVVILIKDLHKSVNHEFERIHDSLTLLDGRIDLIEASLHQSTSPISTSSIGTQFEEEEILLKGLDKPRVVCSDINLENKKEFPTLSPSISLPKEEEKLQRSATPSSPGTKENQASANAQLLKDKASSS